MNTPQSTKAPNAYKDSRASVDTRIPTATDRQWWETFNTYNRDPELTTAERSVFGHLLSYANGPGHERPLEDARPGLDVIIAETPQSKATVCRALESLRTKGYLLQYDKGGTRGTNATTYRLVAPSERVVAVKGAAASRQSAKRGVAAVRDTSRGLTHETPGVSPMRLLGSHGWDPTDSVPTHSPTQNTHVQTAPRPAGSRSVDKAEESKGRTRSKLHPDAVHAWQTAAARPLGLPEEEDLVALRRHLGHDFAEWIDENGKRPPRHCAPAATKAENHADHGPYYRAASSLWSLMAQARADAEVAVMRQPAPPTESRTEGIDAGDHEKLEELDAAREEALTAGTMLPAFAKLSAELEAGRGAGVLADLAPSVARALSVEEPLEEDVDELARQSADLAQAVVAQDRQEGRQDVSTAEDVQGYGKVENGREEAVQALEPLDPFKAAAARAERRHTRRRLAPGVDLVQMHRDRVAAEAAA